MNRTIQFPRALTAAIVLAGLSLTTQAADSSSWIGQYRDDKFLGDRAVFQLSIEQFGGTIQVSFDAAWDDAHGAAPEAQGPATVSGNKLTFKFEDSFGNSGTGTMTRSGNDVLVTINPIHVAEARCLAFYGKNMRLSRVAKK
jgi:hypothetical protein